MDDNDRRELLDWWDEWVILFYFTTTQLIFTLSQVFRDIELESEIEIENVQPACLSIAARMKMQAKAAASAKEKAAIEACNVATAAPKDNQLCPSNRGNGLDDEYGPWSGRNNSVAGCSGARVSPLIDCITV